MIQSVAANLKDNRVHLITYGCQMNKSDSEDVINLLLDDGFEVTENIDDAGIVIFNTCTVRDKAEQRVISNIGHLAKRNKNNKNFIIGMMGCVAQRDGERILKKVEQLSFCVGTRQFPKIPSIIKEVRSTKRKVCNLEENEEVIIEKNSIKREKPYQGWITVTRGCSKYCSYCIVPAVRGHEVSIKPNDIEDQVKRIVDDGVTEVTLLGQIVERYGKDLSTPVSLAELLTRLDKINGLKRLRFITSYPKDFTEELLYAMKELPKVCEHLHMPIQHGNDEMLKQMNRGYTRQEYLELVKKAYEIMPNLNLLSDFICGFPGETEEQHLMSESVISEADFQSSYVFAYSPRPGTQSDKWEDKIPEELKKERVRKLLKIQNEVSLKRNLLKIDTVDEVLVERYDEKKNNWLGRNRGNQIVVFHAERKELVGQYLNVKIREVTNLTLIGDLV
ncbi:MAG: tRNA (N6-isopentenyl adenosine(37)-C2)-methylthiotransferase MiaB [Planctomycetota bacterium]|nr:MAG: tRNA (N6-isopentenyl adenosine(37)-C2)-methylthiotransferase MiaB [Planctomycetota bacterium]